MGALGGVRKGDLVSVAAAASGWLLEGAASALLSEAGRTLMPELARSSLSLAFENGADVLLTLSFTLS